MSHVTFSLLLHQQNNNNIIIIDPLFQFKAYSVCNTTKASALLLLLLLFLLLLITAEDLSPLARYYKRPGHQNELVSRDSRVLYLLNQPSTFSRFFPLLFCCWPLAIATGLSVRSHSQAIRYLIGITCFFKHARARSILYITLLREIGLDGLDPFVIAQHSTAAHVLVLIVFLKVKTQTKKEEEEENDKKHNSCCDRHFGHFYSRTSSLDASHNGLDHGIRLLRWIGWWWRRADNITREWWLIQRWLRESFSSSSSSSSPSIHV